MKTFQTFASKGSKRTFVITILWCCGILIACNQSTATSPKKTSKVIIEEDLPATQDKIDQAILELMQKYNIPGVSVALLKNGQLAQTKTYGLIQIGKDEKINAQTMFSVGSISKVVNAVVTLKLVQEGKLKLDEDINQYLSKWKVPINEFTQNTPVTLRKILSHTAGFSVHGFADYLPEEKTPTTLQILEGVQPAKNDKVELIFPVGSRFKYSGGGISVIQLIIEEVTGLPYHEATRKILFEGLNLKRTSYENPLPQSFGNIAKAHNGEGIPVALPKGYQTMPEQAASGLWTTPSELSKILKAVRDSYQKVGLLSPNLVEDMITAEPNTEFGLGPKIATEDDKTIIYHNGANDSYRARFSIFWNEGSGYIIFTNGTQGLSLINALKPLLNKKCH